MKKGYFESLKGTFIIAEISANHGGDLKRAVSLIREAKRCGADAVKFQTYTADTLTVDVDNKYFKIDHPKWGGQTLYELYKKAYTPWDWFKELKKVADEEGILFFSTAFDKTAVDFLEDLGVGIHKIASFELVDLPLIKYMAKTKKPLILSTGMTTFQEIREAVDAAKSAGAQDIALLRCVSNYPAKPEEMNLMAIPRMKEEFGCTVGLSDHTLGIAASVAGVSLGARVVEKHFTLDRRDETPDSFFSIVPDELKKLAEEIRIAEKALGKSEPGLTTGEERSKIFRRSLFAVKDIKKGHILSDENVRSIRPGHGLMPKYLKDILGKTAEKDIKKGTPLSWNLIKETEEKGSK